MEFHQFKAIPDRYSRKGGSTVLLPDTDSEVVVIAAQRLCKFITE